MPIAHMMHLTADFDDDLERTQSLPVLISAVPHDEPLQRERAARIEVVELMRQNLQQAREIAQLRGERIKDLVSHEKRSHQPVEPNLVTEATLFEVCGALKSALTRVLNECRTRSLSLDCGAAARDVLDNSCDDLEKILSAPETAAPAVFNGDATRKARLMAVKW